MSAKASAPNRAVGGHARAAKLSAERRKEIAAAGGRAKRGTKNRPKQTLPAAPQREWFAGTDAPDSFARICKLANECPITQSCLYDVNLLPEQTSHDPIRWAYTIAIAEHIAMARESGQHF